MQHTLLFFHSIFRWLVLSSLVLAIYTAFKGYQSKALFSQTANRIRHFTATIAHIQLIIGLVLYFQSPAVKQFMATPGWPQRITESLFFGAIHISFMISAVLIITLGSAFSKRKQTAPEKYKTMLIWFSLALVIILIAIPWPFSPLVQRPLIRPLRP